MYYIANDVSVIESTIVELGMDGVGDSRITACTGLGADGSRWSWIETNGGPFAVYEGCELDDDYLQLLRGTLSELRNIDADHADWLEANLIEIEEVPNA